MMKPYKIGYMAGVYDMFHIGHLNLIKRAKEQCEHLIVGVLTDEEVLRWKPHRPIVPFEERLEIIRSIRYVDEAIGVDDSNIDRIDCWHQLHFDCQFSGSDYAENPGWLADQAKLQELGSDIMFFPYTQSTSSSQLRQLISKKLI